MALASPNESWWMLAMSKGISVSVCTGDALVAVGGTWNSEEGSLQSWLSSWKWCGQRTVKGRPNT